MLEYINEFFNVIKLYVQFLFSLQFISGVSFGSILLVSLLLFVIVSNVWPRR